MQVQLQIHEYQLSTPMKILKMFDISLNNIVKKEKKKKLPQLQGTQTHLKMFPETVPSLFIYRSMLY